jgi:hypothetical protein
MSTDISKKSSTSISNVPVTTVLLLNVGIEAVPYSLSLAKTMEGYETYDGLHIVYDTAFQLIYPVSSLYTA